MSSTAQPVCLTIAGLDPSGGAGILADIKTFRAMGCFGAAAVTSITFQNTAGVFGAVHQSAETVRCQIQPILDDFQIAAVKTGMLPDREVIEATADIIRPNKLSNIVVDPVIRSTSGFDLIDEAALESLIKNLFPLADLITPNIPEAERITKMKITDLAAISEAASIMRDLGAKNVLIKGGHFACGIVRGTAVDHLFVGDDKFAFESDYIDTTATHGTGCTLAAAITAGLALGKSINESVQAAKDLVTEAIRTAPMLGHGHSPINI